MNRHNGNNSSIGTASHIEHYYNHPKTSDRTRRSRKKCVQYDKETMMCRHLGITCVGPSNELCKRYQDKTAKKKPIDIGTLVNDPKYGVGMITNTLGPGFYEVRYHKNNVVAKLNHKEVKQILLNQPNHHK